ncbi:MAG: transketolase C-terminal domain-containing protein [Acidimicrobiia bacterium]
MTYRAAVIAALSDEMEADDRVFLMGEDVAAAGGVFKTSDGLHDRFGDRRVFNTPIAENGFVGVALGMAVTGLRPVVEIMFSDFLPSAGDAIVNELPKFRFMSGGQATVPVTVRAIGGATGGFGTQHSATGESWYLQMAGLKIASVSTPAAAYGLLRAAIQDDNPVLVLEHKGLYNRKGLVVRGPDGIAEMGKALVAKEGTDLTIVASMLMLDRAMRAADTLAQHGVDAEVIDLRWLRPLDHETIRRSVDKTGRVLVVAEEYHDGGWAASVVSKLAVEGCSLITPPRILGLPEDMLIPFSPPLEAAVVPSEERIAEAALDALSVR